MGNSKNTFDISKVGNKVLTELGIERPVVNRPDGLTNMEGKVMDHLVKAWEIYVGSLEVQHPSELQEFNDAIHKLQGMLAIRIARREHPEGWPNFYKMGKV